MDKQSQAVKVVTTKFVIDSSEKSGKDNDWDYEKYSDGTYYAWLLKNHGDVNCTNQAIIANTWYVLCSSVIARPSLPLITLYEKQIFQKLESADGNASMPMPGPNGIKLLVLGYGQTTYVSKNTKILYEIKGTWK